MDIDFSALLQGLDVGSGVNAIVAAGTLILAVHFALWLTNTIATWFESHDDSDEEDEEIPAGVFGNEDDGHWCPSCGWQQDDDDNDLATLAAGDSCPKCGE